MENAVTDECCLSEMCHRRAVTHVYHKSRLVQHEGGLGQIGIVFCKKQVIQKSWATVFQYLGDCHKSTTSKSSHCSPSGPEWGQERGYEFCMIRRHFLEGRAAQEGAVRLDTGMMAAGTRHKPSCV